jgi:methyltransferase
LKISIAIPDSSLAEESTQMGKALKISQIARSCAIFRVNTIYIYHESFGTERDRSLLRTTLRYLETPQYLRRLLYGKISDLKFAGSLSPLKIPSHTQTPEIQQIRAGDMREGVVVYSKGKKGLDLGLDKLLPYHGPDEEGKRIIIQFKEGYPTLSLKQIKKEEIKGYWSYDVKESSSLFNLISAWNSFIIFTSRKGKSIKNAQKRLEEVGNSPVLLIFGSPKRGVHEILGKELNKTQKSQILNFFPDQATETVRLEEAILGTLAILNVISH